jgi:hypothetical protein
MLVRFRTKTPDSKRGTAGFSEARNGDKIDVNRIYRLLDALDEKNENTRAYRS